MQENKWHAWGKQIQHVWKYEREQTRGEEIANSISHGLGLVAAIVATPFIIIQAAQFKDTGYPIGQCICRQHDRALSKFNSLSRTLSRRAKAHLSNH